MSRPKANIWQRIAAHQTVVIIMYGYVQGCLAQNNNLTVWEIVKTFAKDEDLDADLQTLYNQYKMYASLVREYRRVK